LKPKNDNTVLLQQNKNRGYTKTWGRENGIMRHKNYQSCLRWLKYLQDSSKLLKLGKVKHLQMSLSSESIDQPPTTLRLTCWWY